MYAYWGQPWSLSYGYCASCHSGVCLSLCVCLHHIHSHIHTYIHALRQTHLYKYTYTHIQTHILKWGAHSTTRRQVPTARAAPRTLIHKYKNKCTHVCIYIYRTWRRLLQHVSRPQLRRLRHRQPTAKKNEVPIPKSQIACHSNTGWRRCIKCLELQVSFHKRATNYRALLRKMTSKDKAFYGWSSPPCTWKLLETWLFRIATKTSADEQRACVCVFELMCAPVFPAGNSQEAALYCVWIVKYMSMLLHI